MFADLCILLLVLATGALAGTFSTPTCAAGRHAITHLFEWKWTDIEHECTRFLGPKGYCGVQVSPPNENAIRPRRPWWERYQPVSYDLVTRSGNEQQFRSMVDTCNKQNVRIYVDAVINHMTGGQSGTGTAGHHYDGNTCSYPAVPFGGGDFNGRDMCPTGDGNIHNYDNPNEVRNCKLVGLVDLRLGKDYVRGKIADYLNKLIDMGVAGFRVDAAKHMWPGDMDAIFGRLHDLPSATFGSGKKPFIFLEVIDMGGTQAVHMSDYIHTARVTEFVYGAKLANIFWRHSDGAKWLINWGQAWGMPAYDDSLVFINNHDNQRGHGGGGAPITFREAKQLKIATAFMLAHSYGFPRIMSSYFWDRHWVNGEDINSYLGPPHNGDMSTKTVQINADDTCGGGWVCEHRWRQIYNMVAFRNVVAGTGVEHFWSRGDYQIAFARGNKGFIAIDATSGTLNANIYTGLPAGTYCDVISGNYDNGRCTGSSVNVDGGGRANIRVNGWSDDPVVAIHIGAKTGSPKKVTT